MTHFVVFGEPFDFVERARQRFEGSVVTLVIEASRARKNAAIATVDAVIEVTDVNHDVDGLLLQVAQHGRPTHVVALVDHLALLAARFAEGAGLDFHSVTTILDIGDKSAMRRRLANVPELAVRAGLVGDEKSLHATAAAIGFPLVVKPADSTGSQGVSIVRSEDVLVTAVERAMAVSATVLLEEFLEGPQFSVEAFSEDGRHVILAVTRKYSDPHTLVELGHVLPADLTESVRMEFAERTALLLDVLQLEYGPSHTEFVLTQRGPVPLETHARVGGDEIYLMVADGVCVDIDALQVEQVFGERVIERLVPRPRTAQATWFGVAEGAVSFQLPAEPSGQAALSVSWLHPDAAPALRSSGDRVFQVRAEAASAAEALEIARSEAERLARAAGLSTRLTQLENVI